MVGQAFTTTHAGMSRTLINDVKVLPADIQNQEKFNLNWKAIWDTGATNSVITQKIVDELELKPVSMITCIGVDGPYDTFCYYIDLYLPNYVAMKKLLVSQGKLVNGDMLIGMDVIGRGDFAVSNFNNQTVFSFRIPSKQKTDYVQQINIEKKIGPKHGKGKHK